MTEEELDGFKELAESIQKNTQEAFIIVNNRDVQSNDELSERIKTILELRGLLDNYDNEKSTLERYRKEVSIIKNRTWKE